MTTRKDYLDPALRAANIEVEPEELLEPDMPVAKGRPSRLKRLKYRLSHYGNRVLESAKRLGITFTETISNVATALAGSILLLPLVILVRGGYVLVDTLFSSIKPLVLSLLRGILDLLRGILWPLRESFGMFNKRVLFPLLKRIEEDDTTALVALVVLVVVVIGVIAALSWIF